jgi:hypothetical protein
MTIATLYAIAERAEQRHQALKRRGQFRQTAAYNEHQLYRIIAKRSWLKASPKALLIKLVNLWMRHRKPTSLPVSIDALAERLKWSANTVRKYLRQLIDRGLIRIAQAGHGRGNTHRYVVDLHAIQQAFDPSASIVTPDETVSCDGEIKGSNGGSPYIEHTTMREHGWSPLRYVLRVPNPSRLIWGLMERIATNRRRSGRVDSPLSPDRSRRVWTASEMFVCGGYDGD